MLDRILNMPLKKYAFLLQTSLKKYRQIFTQNSNVCSFITNKVFYM